MRNRYKQRNGRNKLLPISKLRAHFAHTQRRDRKKVLYLFEQIRGTSTPNHFREGDGNILNKK
jgi:hypothetical protein